MELRQLVYFEAVARCGGFTRAAEQLHIAQPAVSAQVRRLERELGVVLFERTTRRVVLTHAGELLLLRARAVMAELDGARGDLDDLAAVLRGRLRVGVTQVLGAFDLVDSLALFHRRYPDVRITVRTGLIAALLRELDAGAIDGVIGPIHDRLPERFLAKPLVSEQLVLITPPGYRGAESGICTLASVRDEPFVCLPAGSGLHAILTAAAAEQGFEPRIQFEAPDPGGIRAFVAAGLGVALLAESVAQGAGPVVDAHRLKAPPAHPHIGLIRLRARSSTPTFRAWAQHLEHSQRWS